MSKIAGLDYVELKFDKAGKRLDPANPVYPAGVTDLIVISHGWHMDAEDSQNLYRTLMENLTHEANAEWNAAHRKVGVCGVFWPSDKFRDDLGQETFNVLGGQAASTGGDLKSEVLGEQAESIATFLGITDPDFRKKVLLAVGGGGDADVLVDILRQAVGSVDEVDPQTRLDHKDLMTKKGRDILAALKLQGAPALGNGAVSHGGAAAAVGGGAAGGHALGLFSGATAGVARLLNQFAYFELKKRAGIVGQSLAKLLDGAPGLDAVRIHLVGHSFGARLVTSAAAAMTVRKPYSLTLLQAAFSHNAFAAGIKYPILPKITGAFREVITQGKVTGPIAITHTWHDTAVGLAYPAASRVSQTVASAVGVSNLFGGAGDVYGGLGANGALGLNGAEGTESAYDGASPLVLKRGHVNNLRCDFIQNHNDVGRIEAARVVKAAMSR